MYLASLAVHTSASDIVRTYMLGDQCADEVANLLAGYQELETELNNRYCGLSKYPRYYALEHGSSFLLYALVRTARPMIVLETGVGDGKSTYFILSALLANGGGTLHSVDIGSDVAGLLRPREKENWKLHVLDPLSLKESFEAILRGLPPVDLFLHDSDHTYQWQSYELHAISGRLAERAMLAIDDVDSSYAFLDFCKEQRKKPILLIDRRKVFGLIIPCAEALFEHGPLDLLV